MLLAFSRFLETLMRFTFQCLRARVVMLDIGRWIDGTMGVILRLAEFCRKAGTKAKDTKSDFLELPVKICFLGIPSFRTLGAELGYGLQVELEFHKFQSKSEFQVQSTHWTSIPILTDIALPPLR